MKLSEVLKGAQTTRHISTTQRRLEHTTILRLRDMADFERAANCIDPSDAPVTQFATRATA
jgi:hypothetical protein